MSCIEARGIALMSHQIVENRVLVRVWLVLLFCTLLSVVLAERENFTALAAIFVCLIVAIKSSLVIDYLIGLKRANPTLRKVMLTYFCLIPFLIALGEVFPEWVLAMTSVNQR